MKKQFKTLICAMLVAALLFPAAAFGSEESGDSGEKSTAEAASETGTVESAAENSSAGKAIGTEESSGTEETAGEESSGTEDVAAAKKDVMILYTSDVHCGVDQGFGYAGLEQVRKYVQAQGYDVILVDDGDNIQGGYIGSLSQGEIPIDLMNKMGYSVAIPGNHEFDYGLDRFLELTEKAEFPYISCNFQHQGENVFDPYIIREVGGRKIGFVGVTTPKTITSSTPAYFKDKEGNFIYSFMQDETGETVYNAVQSAVDAARKEGAEFVIVMGHLGNEEDCHPWTYADVISHTSGIDAFLDGHSHDTDQVVMKNKEGKSVPRSACGTQLQGIGWCKIPVEGEVSTGLYTWTLEGAAPDIFGIENEMSAAVQEAKDEMEKQIQESIGTSTVNLTVNDPEAVDNNGRPIRMVRRAETNLGDFCTDAFRTRMEADIAVLGGGNVRDNISAGDVKLSDAIRVMPFTKEACKIRVTGQQILDALEWGARSVPSEEGGFLQVSGMSYEIHTYIDSTCAQDTNGMFKGVTGERRVKNVKIGGKPIDPEAAYTVASTEYFLLQNGDGHTAFDGAERLVEGGSMEHIVLADYIRENLGGVIGEEYSDPTGEGRIVIVEEEPAE